MKFMMLVGIVVLSGCSSAVPSNQSPYGAETSEQHPSHSQFMYDPLQCQMLKQSCIGGKYREWDKSSKPSGNNDGRHEPLIEPVGCLCER